MYSLGCSFLRLLAKIGLSLSHQLKVDQKTDPLACVQCHHKVNAFHFHGLSRGCSANNTMSFSSVYGFSSMESSIIRG